MAVIIHAFFLFSSYEVGLYIYFGFVAITILQLFLLAMSNTLMVSPVGTDRSTCNTMALSGPENAPTKFDSKLLQLTRLDPIKTWLLLLIVTETVGFCLVLFLLVGKSTGNAYGLTKVETMMKKMRSKNTKSVMLDMLKLASTLFLERKFIITVLAHPTNP